MKVITIKQPWATLIAKGYKEYEFRTWKTKYRGDILIHAGKGIGKKAMNRFENLNLEYPKGYIIAKAKLAFKDFLEEYKDKSDLGFELKIVHTYHVAENAKKIAQELNLSKEDIELAELIGILHDIGRFEELKITKELNSVKFDHAGHGSEMLFEKCMIRKFIEDNQYDGIIKKAIENHSKLKIEENLDERTLLHSKIIRDADKIDNYRVKKDEKVEAIFPKRVNKKEDMEESNLSD